MKPRYQAAGELPSSDHLGDRDSSSVGIFRVDARIGHAWFARPDNASSAVKRGPEMLPALRKAELILASKGRAIARRATRIPLDAIVRLGGALSPTPPHADAVAAPTGARAAPAANDNAGFLSPRSRMILREVTFLLIMCATLAGTYYLGRKHAFYNVIWVPDTETPKKRLVEAGPLPVAARGVAVI